MFPLPSGCLLRFHVCFQKYPLTPTSSPVSRGATRAGTFRMVLPLLALCSSRYDVRLSFCSRCTWKRGCYQRDSKLAQHRRTVGRMGGNIPEGKKSSCWSREAALTHTCPRKRIQSHIWTEMLPSLLLLWYYRQQ